MIEVVIPAYNAAGFLPETLHSVAAQTEPPARVTVVDDRSTDDTAATARACAEELRGRIDVRVIRNAGPRGPSAARNSAIRQSAAEWIALLDADDVLARQHHAVLRQAAAAAGDVVLAFADSTVFRDAPDGARLTLTEHYLAESGVANMPADAIAPGVWSLGERMFTALLRYGVFGTSACLFRRETALRAGLFDETMMQGEDTDFFLRLTTLGRFAFVGDVVAHKRVHDANLSHARHRLGFGHATALTLTKLEAAADRLGLTAMQREALHAALLVSVDEYLYKASLAGLAEYAQAAALARCSGHPALAANPRHLARLLLQPFVRGGAARPS
jgi:glycosyltransferase involved in cell wall biosynthesis